MSGEFDAGFRFLGYVALLALVAAFICGGLLVWVLLR